MVENSKAAGPGRLRFGRRNQGVYRADRADTLNFPLGSGNWVSRSSRGDVGFGGDLGGG